MVTIKECDGCLKKSKKKREECSMSVVTTSIETYISEHFEGV